MLLDLGRIALVWIVILLVIAFWYWIMKNINTF
ncbi:hypothetical protein NRB20_01110 [Nocardia sp. RB20]|uniref:Uncharacterized protein n=1 Tax=Nocardia macrotermitis TaxID=2585198 RepID=A0A7K0CUD6_9NOCA|nr:hypothetical protein [Nocardia macrotermitis]